MNDTLNRYRTYPDLVRENLRHHSLDAAMEISVGGNFRLIGAIEEGILIEYGLRDGHSVIDVGCGAGRLAVRLGRYPSLKYHGTDISREMLVYAATVCKRSTFSFSHVSAASIPVADECADYVCFFSVLTHILPEEAYLYLEETKRVLKPGGVAIVSFLEFRLSGHMQVFLDTVDHLKSRTLNQELNVFFHSDDLSLLVRHLGFEVLSYHPGDQNFVRLPEPESIKDIADPRDLFTLGQSLLVFRRPV